MQNGRMWGWGHVGDATKIQEDFRTDENPGVLKLSKGKWRGKEIEVLGVP